MIKEFKNQFMQTTTVTIIWITLLVSLFNQNLSVDFTYFWHIIGIGVLFGLVFGVIYPYTWNYSIAIAPFNIMISTFVNFLAGYGALYLFSATMFHHILPYWWGILLLNLILHIIAFYFYRNHQNHQTVTILNNIKKDTL